MCIELVEVIYCALYTFTPKSSYGLKKIFKTYFWYTEGSWRSEWLLPKYKITIKFNFSEKAIIEFLFDALCLSWAGKNEWISCPDVIHNWEEDRQVEK